MTQAHSIKFPPEKFLDFCVDAATPVLNAMRAANGIEPAPPRNGPPVTAEEARQAWDEYQEWETLRWGFPAFQVREIPQLPRPPNRFRERELARAVRAAKSAGGERVEIDPATGKISVILTKGGSAADNEVENWLSKQKG